MKNRKTDKLAEEAGIIKSDMGMTWKTVMPGLGMLGLAGYASSLFLKRRRIAARSARARNETFETVE